MSLTIVADMDSVLLSSCVFPGFPLIRFNEVSASPFVGGGGEEVLALLPPFFLSFLINIYIYIFTCSLLFGGMTHCLLDVQGYFRTFCGEIRRCDNTAIDCCVSSLPVQLTILCDGSFHHAFCFGKISSEVPYYTGTHETDLTWKEKNSLKWKKAEEYLYIRKWSFFINQREMYM